MNTKRTHSAEVLRTIFYRILNEERDHQLLDLRCESVGRRLPSVFSPTNTEELVALVKEAYERKLKYTVFSGGKNWGYGTNAPIEEVDFAIDLGRLKRITSFDDEIGVVEVEAGVTQWDLAQFLASNKSPWMTPCTGAGPEGSLVGNALEKGFGLNPVEDHFKAVISMKVLLPDGEFLVDRLSEIGASKSSQVSRWKLGPTLEGLFAQSNFGIVTSVVLELSPQPQSITLCIIKSPESRFKDLIGLLQKLRMENPGFLGALNISNRARLELTTGSDLSVEKNTFLGRLLSSQIGLSDWQVILPLVSASKSFQSVHRCILRQIKDQKFDVVSLSKERLGIIEKLFSILPAQSLPQTRQRVKDARNVINLLRGVPSNFTLKTIYGDPEKMKHFSGNPARDRVGLLWFAPILRFKSSDLEIFKDICESLLPHYKQKSLITFTNFDSKLVEATLPIIFDINNPEATELAYQCWDALYQECLGHGFSPYRFSTAHMSKINSLELNSVKVTKRIKNLFDPDNILNPGRYCP